MFTGIIEAKGTVRAVRSSKNTLRVTVEKPRTWKVPKGGSVAVDGICLTSVGRPGADLAFDIAPETAAKTTAKYLRVGRIVNLERPLKAGAELGGHFVLGHVDTRAKVVRVKVRGTSREVTISVPPRFRRLVAEVGSIAVNGVSLTVAKKEKNAVTVSLVPHTLAATNLGAVEKGSEVNVEFDVLARYLAALLERW